MHNIGTTVAAISTPPGKGGVALIRVSGPDAVAIASRVFRPRSGRALADILPRMQTYGDIFYQNEPIDDGMAVRFAAPHSYTGEDVVEITCHGGVRLSATVLRSLTLAGARVAEAGEFTRRAFLNGRLTLTDAETIAQLIDAETEGQIRLSRAAARDRLSARLQALSTSLVRVMSSMYARIDYPDEDLGEFTEAEAEAALRAALSDAADLLSTYRTGRAVMTGVRTVICGKPNVGKSTLYNALLGEEAAIVTPVAGTTRDVLERCVSVGSLTLRLADTAGLHPTGDPVEAIGVERTREHLDEAELVLAVFDGARAADADDEALIAHLHTLRCPCVALINKADLPRVFDAPLVGFDAVLTLSAASGETDGLVGVIEGLYADERLIAGECAVLTTERQYAALHRATEHLSAAADALHSGLPVDVASSDLALAIGALGEMCGTEVAEQIVADIFSKFCVGK